jgi:antitoxin YefM
MKTASFTEFRQNLKNHLEAIENDQDILVLSGPKKKGFVILTLEQYDAMEETAHLLSTPSNASRLAQGLKELEDGKVVVKKLKLK